MLFHSRHATWHALQPMHFETSMSFDTGVSCFAGGEIFDADRLTRSSSPNATFTFVVGAGGRTYSKFAIVPPSLCHRPGNGLDIDQKRLVLRRLDIGVTNVGRQRIGTEALPRLAHESPVQRNADDMDRLAVALKGDDAFGDDRFCFHRSTL